MSTKQTLSSTDVSEQVIKYVNGFIRRVERDFHEEYGGNPYINIPPLVRDFCILYCRIYEKFERSGSGLKISRIHENKIENLSRAWGTALGQIEIDFNEKPSAVYEWKFKSKYAVRKKHNHRVV